MDNQEAIFQAKDEATLERLKKLRHKVLTGDISTARRGAYHLSWLQEDGLIILKEALFGDYTREAKKAAAYGLRKMRGRMKKMALEVLEKGAQSRDKTTKAACIKSLDLIRGTAPAKEKPRTKTRPARRKINEIPHKDRKSTRRTGYRPSRKKN